MAELKIKQEQRAKIEEQHRQQRESAKLAKHEAERQELAESERIVAQGHA